MKRDHVRLSDVHGLQRLAVDATLGITDLVEALHRAILDVRPPIGKSRGGRTRGVTGFAYTSVRGVTRAVGAGADAVLGRLAGIGNNRASSPEREAVLAALNGVLGDYLAETHNPLAIPMRVRKGGVAVPITRDGLAAAFAPAAGNVAVLLHGLCMNDLMWSRDGHDHGAALAADLGLTPVYLHYDTGSSVAANGRDLDALMDALVRAWPGPIERLVFIGHSMGGLVARSAMEAAAKHGHAWIDRVDACVFLGTPHQGAPLERAGAWVDYLIGISPYSAPFARLGQLRSAGIQDLRHGLHEQAALPAHVQAYAIAASTQKTPSLRGRRIRGDGLVTVKSALGMEMPESHRYVAYGTGHLGLLSSRGAYERMRAWLEARNASAISSTTR
jgi:pimeloyl-ACP methyl ester carboxylesterase